VEALRADFNKGDRGEPEPPDFLRRLLSTKRERMIRSRGRSADIAKKFNINPESISYARQVYDKIDRQVLGGFFP